MVLLKKLFLHSPMACFILRRGLPVCLAVALCSICMYIKARPLTYETYALYVTAREMTIGSVGCLVFTVGTALLSSTVRVPKSGIK